MPIHLSVQANTVNGASAKFWRSVGISRVILSRELSFDEIEEVRQDCPEMELEVFVHGALCIAYSGRCLLSGYMSHRDSNQGACTNACRWDYKVKPGQQNQSGDVVLLQEARRPDDLMPMEEDEHGTYIMNSKDLRAVEHIERLTKMGVDSFKIEGRISNCTSLSICH
jgi:U32 family peptidase